MKAMDSFALYTRTLDYLTTVHLSREQRIDAAWRAGGGKGPAPAPLASPYLFDQLREAFRLGGVGIR